MLFRSAATAASVTSVSVLPGSGRADVVIAVRGSVDVMDFALDGGKRVVVDITGATLGVPARMYDRVPRAAIANVRFAQFKPEVVRIVVELDAAREYSVVRGEGEVRVSIDGGAAFEPWLAQGQGGKPAATTASTTQGGGKPEPVADPVRSEEAHV